MRPIRKHGAALFLSVLLAGGSAFGQTTPSAPVPPGDATRQPVGQDPPAAFVPPAPLQENAPSGAAVPDACWGDCQACQGYGRFWVTTEALLWWMKGERLPPLVTTSPAGTPQNQAGVLGADNTTVLFGNSTVNNGAQGGWQINTGYWLDQNRRWGIEGNFFMLSTQNTNFSASSNGDPILARPFFDAVTNQNSSELVALPGLAKGSISASALTTGLIGAGAMFRANLCCDSCFRIDWLGGYRYLNFSDRLNVNESLTSTNPDSFVVPGTTIAVGDRFATRNTFNGFNTGLSAQFQRGPWALEGLATVAVGDNHRVVSIDGATTVTVPGLPSVTNAGGLLALPSNIGRFGGDHVAVIPQFGMNLYYQITPWLRATAGYTFLLWPEVVRSADAIDTTVNPNLLPPTNPLGGGPARPAFTGGTSTFWAQGISAGLQLRF
jgi:hypothetical protein